MIHANSSWAQLDLQAMDIMISKLELASSQLDKSVEQKTPLLLRLADLYADRARQKFIIENEKNCQNCEGSQNDRRSSLKNYQLIFDFLKSSEQGAVLVQMAHLHLALNEQKIAKNVLNRALNKKKYSPEVRSKAHAGLGEIAFHNAEFSKAEQEFLSALALTGLNERSAIWQYRLAWARLNQGKTRLAIQSLETLLNQPENLGSAPPDYSSFHEDISRDYATFLAKVKIEKQSLSKLLRVTPPSALKDNLHFFASEAERLSQPEGALLIWSAYSDLKDLLIGEKQEVDLRRAQMHLDLRQVSKALEIYAKAIQSISKTKCRGTPEACQEIRVRARNFVTNWNKQEKKKPTLSLFKAYQIALRLFADDAEMHFWAGRVAEYLKLNKEAFELHRTGSILAQKNLPDLKSVFEGSLLAQIEVSEKMQSPQMRAKAYEHYLTLNPNGDKSFEVQYQQVHLLYEQKKYLEAAQGFRNLALKSKTRKEDREFLLKSADLALDSLALLKRDDMIQSWSAEFATKFPERQQEFRNLNQKASLNLAAQSLNKKQLTQSELDKIKSLLPTTLSSGSTEQEKISYWKSKLLLAEHLRDLSEVDRAARELIKLTKPQSDSHKLALRSRQWVAEMRLNFPTAYELFNQTNATAKDPQSLLKRAILSELAGKPSQHLYKSFIKATPSRRQANEVRVKLILESTKPWQAIKNELTALRHSPDLLATISLFAWHKEPHHTKADQILRIKGVRDSRDGKALYRTVFLRDFDKSLVKIQKQKLNSSSDPKLAQSIQSRVNGLDELTKMTNAAIRSKDPVLQIITLSALSSQNRRFYHELLALPTPRGLGPQQRVEYQQALQSRATPYLSESEKVDVKLNTFWSAPEFLAPLQEGAKEPLFEIRQAYQSDLKRIAIFAPSQFASQLQETTQKPFIKPSRKQILQARAEVANDPFNTNKLTQLKALEELAGGEAMVTYLEARLLQLQDGGKP